MSAFIIADDFIGTAGSQLNGRVPSQTVNNAVWIVDSPAGMLLDGLGKVVNSVNLNAAQISPFTTLPAPPYFASVVQCEIFTNGVALPLGQPYGSVLIDTSIGALSLGAYKHDPSGEIRVAVSHNGVPIHDVNIGVQTSYILRLELNDEIVSAYLDNEIFYLGAFAGEPETIGRVSGLRNGVSFASFSCALSYIETNTTVEFGDTFRMANFSMPKNPFGIPGPSKI